MAKCKIILLMMLCVCNAYTLSACDICGCSSGNYFIGPFPQFNKHFAGMRYSFRDYTTVLKSDNTQFSRDHYQTTELLLGTQVGKNWQLLMFVPFSVNRSVTDDGTKLNQGLGDVTLMGNYNLFNTLKLTADTQTIQQQLWLGGGVKIPTGKFSPDPDEITSSANSQPGTGSLDFLLTATYTFKIKKWGFNTNATYKKNQSASGFTFGNRFAASTFVSRTFNLKQISFNPNAGLLYEHLGANTNNEVAIENSGGYALLSAIGLEIRINRMALGGNVQLPVISDLSGGQTNVRLRGMVQLSYVF
jgi:hypothetical protein